MNRENTCTSQGSQRRALPRVHLSGYLPKERCVIWLPERKAYLRGVTAHALYTVPDWAVDGDRATDLAEKIMTTHGARAAIRTCPAHVINSAQSARESERLPA